MMLHMSVLQDLEHGGSLFVLDSGIHKITTSGSSSMQGTDGEPIMVSTEEEEDRTVSLMKILLSFVGDKASAYISSLLVSNPLCSFNVSSFLFRIPTEFLS